MEIRHSAQYNGIKNLAMQLFIQLMSFLGFCDVQISMGYQMVTREIRK